MAWYRKWCRKRRPEDGFTLIELAVVMLIISILLVVSLAFFGLISSAHTSVATQDLKGAQVAVQTLWVESGGHFNGITQAQLNAAEPGVQFEPINANGYNSGVDGSQSVPTTPSNPTSIAWNYVSGGWGMTLTAYSNANGGECIVILDLADSSSYMVTNNVFPSAGIWWGESYSGDGGAATGVMNPVSGACTSPIADSNYITNDTGWSQLPPST